MWMDRAALEREWDHTAALMAFIANALKGKDGRRVTVEDLHPIRQAARQQRKRRIPFEHLKAAIANNGHGRSD